MDKKSIIGIVLTGLIFVGFAIYTSKQQKEYQQKLQEYNAYVAQHEQAEADLQSVVDAATAHSAEAGEAVSGAEREQLLKVARYGATLAEARGGEAQIVTLENDYLKLDISSLGGQIVGAELKEYTRYAPKDERTEPIKMFDPATANFDMSFYVKNGVNNVQVNTSEYNFEVLPVEKNDSLQRVTMRLHVGEGAYYVYEYTLHNEAEPSCDYLVDFKVRLENMAPLMAKQSSIGIDWSNRSYQNERGFKNENMYTTIAYRLPGEAAIEELGMSEESKSDEVSSSVNWVAFKQQFFSSVFIAPDNVTYANMAFETAKPGSGYIKDFSVEMAVPYDAEVNEYDFSFYFGPNKYAVLKKIVDENGDKIALERLIPLGWGIFGWINRWFVIPVFDFLRHYIPSFGIIILILALLVRVIIFPLTYKSYLSTAKIRVIQPEIAALNEKYPRQEDAMKKQQATMELYKKAGINPMGGCLPMLIQMPVLIAMFRFFPASIELRGESFLWSHDLSSYDSVLNLPFNIPFYGDHVSLFCLLMAAAMFLFSYINYNQSAASQPQMAGMKFMMVYMMPIMMIMWFNNYSSGLNYYYFLSSLLSMAQTFLIRTMVDDNKVHAMIHNAKKNTKGKKSRFQQRYEELLRQQEELQKQQTKNSRK